MMMVAGYLHALSVGLVRAVASGFGYGFFWCLASAIYLVLRHDVDQTEFDEVYVENEVRRYELPSLGPDQSEVAEDAKTGTESQNDASAPAEKDER
jgi:hypothetical protein